MFNRFKDSFDPETLATLGQAFDLAWNYIEQSGAPAFADRDDGQYKLASILVALAQNGESNKIALANKAIAQLREAEQICHPKDRPPSIWSAGKHL